MVDLYVKNRVLYHASRGLNPFQISRALSEEGIVYSRVSEWVLLRKFKESQSIARNPDLGCIQKSHRG